MLPSTTGGVLVVAFLVAPGALWLFLYAKRRPSADLRTSTDIGYVLFVGLIASAMGLGLTVAAWRILDEPGYRRIHDLLAESGGWARFGLAAPTILGSSTLAVALALVVLTFTWERLAKLLYGERTEAERDPFTVLMKDVAQLNPATFYVLLDSDDTIIGADWHYESDTLFLTSPIKRKKAAATAFVASPEAAVAIPMSRIVTLGIGLPPTP